MNGTLAAFWALAARQGTMVDFPRVPSKANVADAVSGDDFARARREGCTRVTSRRRPLYHYICTSWRRRSTTCSMRWMVRRLTCWRALLSGLVSRRLVGLCAPGPGGADMRTRRRPLDQNLHAERRLQRYHPHDEKECVVQFWRQS